MLPIVPYLSEIMAAPDRNRIVIATPGSGKTTCIPPALAETGGKVLCVEPRRLACIGAASRIARERQEKIGEFVGYHVRLDRKISSQTQLIFLTTGMMLQYLCADPFLEDVSCVIFDEFHERSMDADIALAMMRYLQREARDDLRIMIMSATIEAKNISDYLGECRTFDIHAPIYPLEIRYMPHTFGMRPNDYLPAVLEACRTCISEKPGDCLVFLPGLAEIHAAIAAASPEFGADFDLCACHASLPLEEQHLILNPKSERRRIIFSTNVAESSLTIPGVHAVVDAGLVKRKFFDSVCGLSRLETQHISKASADQRAGRAARLGPGLCIRLWSETAHQQLQAQSSPEIDHLDLCQAWLQIAAWGLESPQTLAFLTAPASGRLTDARDLLQKLGAIEGDELTEIGRQMAALPVEPRLARWLIAAKQLHCLKEASLLAAFLSEASYRRSQRNLWPGTDLAADFEILKKEIRKPEFSHLRRIADDIFESARDISLSDETATQYPPLEAMARAMLSAYPDRLAQPRPSKEKFTESDPRRNTQPIYALMSGNRGVVIREAQTLKDAKFFICADLDLVKGIERAANTVVKAFPVEPRWIPWQDGVTARYEEDKDRVVIAQAVYFDIFRLRETFLHDEKYNALRYQTLLQAAQKKPLKALNLKSDAWSQLKSRLEFIKKLDNSLLIPELDIEWAASFLPDMCRHAENFEQLQAMDLSRYALKNFDSNVTYALQRLAPERIKLENGFETAVDYTQNPPVVSVKIQKAFGTYRLPAVGGGKIPVMMHLCAPNGRPAQVTQDLQSFWTQTYTDVRKQLRGRYPKHDWPEKAP